MEGCLKMDLKQFFVLLRKISIKDKMDLNKFVGNNEKRIYKITFMLSESKIKRFVYGTSKENAKYVLEQDIKKENHDEKFKMIDIEDITDKHAKLVV